MWEAAVSLGRMIGRHWRGLVTGQAEPWYRRKTLEAPEDRQEVRVNRAHCVPLCRLQLPVAAYSHESLTV